MGLTRNARWVLNEWKIVPQQTYRGPLTLLREVREEGRKLKGSIRRKESPIPPRQLSLSEWRMLWLDDLAGSIIAVDSLALFQMETETIYAQVGVEDAASLFFSSRLISSTFSFSLASLAISALAPNLQHLPNAPSAPLFNITNVNSSLFFYPVTFSSTFPLESEICNTS